jgi:hypothetical protein
MPALSRIMALPIQRTCTLTTNNTKPAPAIRSRDVTGFARSATVRPPSLGFFTSSLDDQLLDERAGDVSDGDVSFLNALRVL